MEGSILREHCTFHHIDFIVIPERKKAGGVSAFEMIGKKVSQGGRTTCVRRGPSVDRARRRSSDVPWLKIKSYKERSGVPHHPN